MSDPRFRPPSVPDLPAEVLPRRSPTPDPEEPLALPNVVVKPRRAVRYRRPMNTPLVIWLLASIGAGAIFFALTKGLRRVVESPPALPQFPAIVNTNDKAPPTNWQPLGDQAGVLIDLEVSPRDARIFVDGQPASSNPVRLPRGDRVHEIVVAAPGHETRTLKLSADRARSLKVTLPKAAQR